MSVLLGALAWDRTSLPPNILREEKGCAPTSPSLFRVYELWGTMNFADEESYVGSQCYDMNMSMMRAMDYEL